MAFAALELDQRHKKGAHIWRLPVFARLQNHLTLLGDFVELKGVMQRLHSQFHVFPVDQNRNFDF